jgi:leucine dehydrogenase
MDMKPDKSICELYAEAEHESVTLSCDPTCGYRGIIAIHSTALGPALGGTRFWDYGCDKAASRDSLRLSRAMSYKNALAGIPFGGGKAVIIGDNKRTDREDLFRAHGRFVESLGGRFITAEDVGTSPADMEYVHQETSYVAGLPSRSGNPSPITAKGVFRALQACAKHLWGRESVAKRTVTIQGCGSTGYHLAKELHKDGAKLIVSDIDKARVRRVVDEFGAAVVEPGEVFETDADVFSPCALGGVLNDDTIRRLKVSIVVGSANNQLLEEAHGEALASLNILFAPDFVANSGGVINGCRELLGWDEGAALAKVDEIYLRMISIFRAADSAGEPPFKTANRMARELITRAR